MKLTEGLNVLQRIRQLEDQLAEARADRCHLYDRLDGETQRRVAAEDRLALVSAKLVTGDEFLTWLMEQDASSAEKFSPSKPRKKIEGKNDVELALMFADRGHLN